MLSAKTRTNIKRILPFGIIWLVFSLSYSLVEKGILGDADIYPATGNPYDFTSNLSITLFMAFFCGLLMGVVEVYFLNRVFRTKSLAKKIIYKSGIYICFMILFLLFTSLIANAAELNKGITDREVWQNTSTFLCSFAFWSIEFFLAIGILSSLFYFEVSDYLGFGVLMNFVSGKYHSPIEEDRVFMFLDMKSSTGIAEKLGHRKYFELLQMYYTDLTDPIINCNGEIYKYVGDEIIVSWKLENGVKNNNCLRCFFQMKEAMESHAEKYKGQFGLVPTFKAGMHHGQVTSGEIGVIKKAITFSGDVLNTTARIQGLCNSKNVDILISGTLANKLKLTPDIVLSALGQSQLRGRNEKIELYTLKSHIKA